jgi:hypothetical protein
MGTEEFPDDLVRIDVTACSSDQKYGEVLIAARPCVTATSDFIQHYLSIIRTVSIDVLVNPTKIEEVRVR